MGKNIFGLAILVCSMMFVSCDRDEEISGCTDHLAENHDPRATVDDGSCTFSADQQIIWKDGVPGGWNGNLVTYGIVPTTCFGTMTVLSDTSQASQPALIVADEDGNARVQFELLNPRTARNYIEGFIHFDISKPEASSLTTLKIYTHGKLPDNAPGCGAFNRSEWIELSVLAITSEEFQSVAVPFRDFDDLMLADVHVMFGIVLEGLAPGEEALSINNIRWTRF
jgi:hypothetical protein